MKPKPKLVARRTLAERLRGLERILILQAAWQEAGCDYVHGLLPSRQVDRLSRRFRSLVLRELR